MKFDHIEVPGMPRVEPFGHVDIYPVGVLADLQRDWRMVAKYRMRPVYLRRSLRYLWQRARRREWRAIRMSFNGYLAEPCEWPDGLTRCGSGWTRRRAMRRLCRFAGVPFDAALDLASRR